MSICSYSNYEAIFPKDTPLSAKSWEYDRAVEFGDSLRLYVEQDGTYYETFLDELIKLFDKPLDEVPGLHLDAYYQSYEDEGWQFTLHIDDGKVECEQTEIVWNKTTPEKVGVDIGRRDVDAAKEVWKQLEDVCIDDDGNVDDVVRISAPNFYHWYPKGTNREDIWHDIEDRLHVSVAYLMGLAKNPDGTN